MPVLGDSGTGIENSRVLSCVNGGSLPLTLLAWLPPGTVGTEPSGWGGTLSPTSPETTVKHKEELGSCFVCFSKPWLMTYVDDPSSLGF